MHLPHSHPDQIVSGVYYPKETVIFLKILIKLGS